MIKMKMSAKVRCDRCGPNGTHPSAVRRLFSPKLNITGQSKASCTSQIKAKGWWVGRLYILCPRCNKAEKKQSRAKSRVVHLQQRDAV